MVKLAVGTNFSFMFPPFSAYVPKQFLISMQISNSNAIISH